MPVAAVVGRGDCLVMRHIKHNGRECTRITTKH